MANTSISKRFSKDLLRWYHQYGRFDLPWQHNKTAYRVWVSEIMLQQTQVATVIPYYQRFIRSFPNVKQLALASQDYVLTHWSGLGYYARARNLHKTAQAIHQNYRGRFPQSLEALQTLPGIGKSTAGAILSFAYNLPMTICDGNVKRVLARVFAINIPKQSTEASNLFWSLATQLTPQRDTAFYNQAIMDVGATICTRNKPKCSNCPFNNYCQAHLTGNETAYPVSHQKKTNPIKSLHMLLLENLQGALLLEKRPQTGIWGGLWSFPECELETDIKQHCEQQFGLRLLRCTSLKTLSHKFSHYTLNIRPLKIKVDALKDILSKQQRYYWHFPDTPLPGGIPRAICKIG